MSTTSSSIGSAKSSSSVSESSSSSSPSGPVCYRIAGDGSYGWDCCADGGCCNYADSSIDEILTGGPATWSAYGRGPVGTSDWTLERQGAGPNYTWVLTNNCQAGCHPGAYTGTATWDGEGNKEFPMGNYPPLTVTKVNCP